MRISIYVITIFTNDDTLAIEYDGIICTAYVTMVYPYIFTGQRWKTNLY
jgi:hypothetical protein